MNTLYVFWLKSCVWIKAFESDNRGRRTSLSSTTFIMTCQQQKFFLPKNRPQFNVILVYMSAIDFFCRRTGLSSTTFIMTCQQQNFFLPKNRPQFNVIHVNMSAIEFFLPKNRPQFNDIHDDMSAIEFSFYQRTGLNSTSFMLTYQQQNFFPALISLTPFYKC